MAINPEFQGGSVTDDPVVNEVIDIVCKRHMQGMSKFGKTMDENERPFDQWIGELVEELLDAVHYAIKAKKIIEKFKTKEKSLEAMLATFKKETFVEEKKQTLPSDSTNITVPDEDWDNPPERDTNDENKKEEST